MTQSFRRIWYTPDEAAQIITSCEERLLKANIITKLFIVAEIQGGILKEHLCDDDYLAPHKVIVNRLQFIYLSFWLFCNWLLITEEINCRFDFQCAEQLEVHHLALEETVKVQEPHIDSDDEGKVRTSAYLKCSPFFLFVSLSYYICKFSLQQK